MANMIYVEVKNIDELFEFCEQGNENSDKAMRACMSDVKARAKGWIASAVTELYTISKGDVTGGEVNISMSGNENDLSMTYVGGPVAMEEYSYEPKSRPAGDYNTYAEVMKGKKVQVGEYTKKRTGKHVQRSSYLIMNHLTERIGTGGDRHYKMATGPAVPSIMASEHGRPKVEEKLSKMVEERIDHAMNRFFGD